MMSKLVSTALVTCCVVGVFGALLAGGFGHNAVMAQTPGAPDCNGQTASLDETQCKDRGCNSSCTSAIQNLNDPFKCSTVDAVPTDCCLPIPNEFMPCTQTWTCVRNLTTDECQRTTKYGSANPVQLVEDKHPCNLGG